MRALDDMKRCHPKRRLRTESMLDFGCVSIGKIQRNKKGRIGVDGHGGGHCDGLQWNLNSDRVPQSPHRLRAIFGRQRLPYAQWQNRASRRAAEAIPVEQCGQSLHLAPGVRQFCRHAAKPSDAWCPEADEYLRWAFENCVTTCGTSQGCSISVPLLPSVVEDLAEGRCDSRPPSAIFDRDPHDPTFRRGQALRPQAVIRER